jgi:hypothetical protein
MRSSFSYLVGFVPIDAGTIFAGFVVGTTTFVECTASFLNSPNLRALPAAHKMFARISADRRSDVSVAAINIFNWPLSLDVVCQTDRPIWKFVWLSTCEKSISEVAPVGWTVSPIP